MGVKKQPRGGKKNSGSAVGSAKQFQLLNGVITKEDITPLAKSQRSQTGGSDSESVDSADLLFSPLGSGAAEEEEEEDEFDHGLLSPVYFGAMYPKRFHHHSSADEEAAVESRRNSVSAYALRDLVGAGGNGDFWKEVAATSQEAIFASCPLELPSESAGCVEESCNTSLDEFISADLGTSTSVPPQWDEDYKIKLLCYRDAAGNLRLRTQEDSYTVSRNSSVPVKKVKVGKSRKGKSGKLLKSAIRRKSGVREMVSTGIGIGEFML